MKELLKEAYISYKNNQFGKVVNLLSPIINEIDNYKILFSYGKSLVLLGDNIGIEYLLKSLSISPNNIDILGEIALFYLNDENLIECEYYVNKAIVIENNNPNILYLKGCLKVLEENLREALFFFQKSYNIQPNFIPLLIDIANTFKKLKEYDKAISFYEKILNLEPHNKATFNNLGLIYLLLKNIEKSEFYFFKCLDIEEENYNLFYDKFEFWQEFFLSRKLNSELIKYLIAFSEMLSEKNNIEEALFILDYLEIKNFSTKNILYLAKGNILARIGDAKNSIKNYIEAVNIKKNNNSSALNNIISIYYYDNYDTDKYISYLKLFNSLQINKKKYKDFLNTDNKKIRIGYLSPDFNRHSIIYFLYPIYENYNKDKFEIYSYYTEKTEDEYTNHFKNNSDKWNSVYNLDNEEIANIIYNDKIDILVDLSGFTDKNRIEVFSYKPAPTQISMIGYSGTTGLDTMDYKLLDKTLSNTKEDYFSEKIINIQDTMFCYKQIDNLPNISESPYLKNKYLTFASFNNGIKITEYTILFWSKILNKYKNSKLIIKCEQNKYPLFREKILNLFKKYNISSKRIEFFNRINSTIEHLNLYNTIDISLDTYPYNGVTTTFESLIMGIPVLTFTGGITNSRYGKSILKNLGLDNWVIEDLDKEINIDLDNLKYLRKNLREKLLSSVLCDHKGFTLKLENIYQDILRR